MTCMDGSPRNMTTLGGHVIAEKSQLVPRLHADDELTSLLSCLTGQAVAPVPDPVERHVLNILHQEGDAHGGHTDDYPYALVLFLEAPRLALSSPGSPIEAAPLRTADRPTSTPGTPKSWPPFALLRHSCAGA
ncbi:hypothetical protein ACFYPA_29160 [Streptomyces sp. NPDC005775]|uniref:HalD/BesD family halogenase n=1 Tax=Streptomyces sp. NPDC005775 TaxID=3364729 RepID=UPI0036913BBA